MMIKTASKFLLVFSLLSTTSIVMAKDTGEHPCKKIMTACKAAGYDKDEEDNVRQDNIKQIKNTHIALLKNCVVPIIQGKTVKGVSIPPEVIKACNAEGTKRKAKK